MSFPISGFWQVRVLEAREFSIHGDRYWELWVVRREDETSGQPHVLRVPVHTLSIPVSVGQMIRVEFLLGQVVSVRSDPG